jgi:hypothetical protein
VPGISLRNDFTPDQELLGINCRGSSECRGICHPNMGNIKYFVDQIGEYNANIIPACFSYELKR